MSGTDAEDGMGAEDMAYRARALAQAHPLTPIAKRYLDRAVEDQARAQPLPEIGRWAGAALLTGYCVRRVEEEELGLRPEDDGTSAGLDELDEAAARIAGDLRDSGAAVVSRSTLGHDSDQQSERVIAALDRVVASEVSRRLDNWRDSVDEKAWIELEDYICWWVVRGYALRAAEIGLRRPVPR